MTNGIDDSDDDEVGYKRPPKHTRFKKGQSGNPKGRPKGTRNFKTDVAEVLDEQILVTENGTSIPMSKQLAVIKRTAQKALGGDLRATSMLLGWRIQLFDISAEETESNDLSPDDEAIIQRYLSQSCNDDDDPDGGAA